MNIFCTNCGIKIEAGNRFCTQCGNSIEEVAGQSVDEAKETFVSFETHDNNFSEDNIVEEKNGGLS